MRNLGSGKLHSSYHNKCIKGVGTGEHLKKYFYWLRTGKKPDMENWSKCPHSCLCRQVISMQAKPKHLHVSAAHIPVSL